MNMHSIFVPETLPPEHPCAVCPIRMRTFCATLDAQALAQFRALGSTLRLASRQPLFHEGAPARTVYSLTAGMLNLYKLLPDGRRQVMGFVLPGDFLGITIDDEHAFSAEAVGPVELCRFPRGRFDAFIDAHPRMERELYRLAAHELAAAQRQMVLLGRKTACERLASFLVGLAGRMHERGHPADLVRLPMSRLDIADHLGLTKETVSRVFTSLKTSGVVRLLAGDMVRIVDAERLGRLADAH